MPYVSCPVCVNALTTYIGKEVQQPDADGMETGETKKGNNDTMIFVLLAVAAVGGAGYYLKIYKPKHKLDDAEDLDDLLDNGNELEVNEEEADFRASEQVFIGQADTETEDGMKRQFMTIPPVTIIVCIMGLKPSP